MADLLIQWEDLYKQGQDTPPAVLCKDHPELAETLARQIAALKRVSWLDKKLEDDDGGDPPADLPDDPRPPRVLAGRYRLDHLIATGGFAEVWRAFDQELQRIIAIKIPKRTVIGAADSFLAEARRVARLQHPSILPVYDVGLDGDDCFFVSEYVKGGSLADRLIKGKLPAEEACRWVAGIAEALEHAHAAGVIHRDVKPANILLDAHDRALLADFGIAQSSMKSGAFAPSLGTLRYMAPEQLDGQAAVPQSDIYSLGVVLHEALTGKPPYSSDDPNTLRREIGSGAKLSKDVPSRLVTALRKALNKDPGQRFVSAAEFAAAVRSSQKSTSWLLPLGTAAAVMLTAFGLWSVLAKRPSPFTPSLSSETVRPLQQDPTTVALAESVTPPTASVSDSIDAAVQWLLVHQGNDGGWSFDLNECSACSGQCRNSGSYPDRAGATALALLTMLGRGYTHRTGPHKEQLAAGIKFLADRASQENGRLHVDGSHAFWAQAWATLALTECYAMTSDSDLAAPAQLALNYVTLCQDQVTGGWPDAPGQPTSTASVAWHLPVIRSGLLAGLTVDPRTLPLADKYLQGASRDDKYTNPSRASREGFPTLIAHLYGRMMSGCDRTLPPYPQAVNQLLTSGPCPDLRSTYFGSQIAHFVDIKTGTIEFLWNKTMRAPLQHSQVVDGHSAGSWFDGTDNELPFDGGRLYCTSLAAMSLQVYFQHLPLYQADPAARPTIERTGAAPQSSVIRKEMPYPLPPFNRREWRSQPPDEGLVYRFDEASGWWLHYRDSGPVEFRFQQTRVTDTGIELEDPSRQMRITLTGTACNSRSSPTYPHDVVLAPGAWVKESGSPLPPEFDQQISLVSERDSLEVYLQKLSRTTGVIISLNVPALTLEGITKNQTFAFDMTETPASEVLTAVLQKADPQDRLRAVLRATDDGKTGIDVTTKQALDKQD